MKYLLKVRAWKVFLVLSALYILFAYLDDSILVNDDLYYNSLGEELTIDRIQKLIENRYKWDWIAYGFEPLVVLLRALYTSLFLFIGVFFTEKKVNFASLFKISLLADFIFVFAALLRLLILLFSKEVSTFDDLSFQPFSLINLFDEERLELFVVYPLSLVNIFELSYFFLLAFFLRIILAESNVKTIAYGKSLAVVALSYGGGILLWVIFIMFLTINVM
jgi:hypothetical protein